MILYNAFNKNGGETFKKIVSLISTAVSSPVLVYSFSLQLSYSFNLSPYPGSGDEEEKKNKKIL